MARATRAERVREAAHLRTVLDAGQLRVPVASLPESADAVSPVSPLPDAAPWLVLVRDGDRWVFADETLAAVPDLHRAAFSSPSRWFQQAIPASPTGRWLGLYPWQLAYALALGVTAFVVARAARGLVTGRLRALARRAGFDAGDAWRARLDLPVTLLSLGALAHFGTTDLALPPTWSGPLRVGAHLVLGFGVLLLASRFVGLGGEVAKARAKVSEARFDDQVVPVVEQASQVVVWVAGTLLLLQLSGVEVWGFLAGLGIGSLAIALAAQDSLANLFGALNIFLDRPFQVGDWIVVDGLEGTVEEVGFRSCRVRTFHNSLLTIPNSRITSAEVDNYGARMRRRVKTTLGVTYDTPPDRLASFVEDVRALLAADPAVDPAYEVHFHQFGASALEILLYFHIRAPNWSEELEVRSRVFLAIVRLAERVGVSFAFPTVQIEGLPREWRAPAA